jgi:uncharacterized protein YaaN involved in tellurite resistance
MSFTMEVPDEAEIKKEVLDQVKPVPSEVEQLNELAISNVDEIIKLEIDDGRTKDFIQKIEGLGADTIKRSTDRNSLLQVTVGKLSRDGDDGDLVTKGLVDLQREFRRLDPSLIYLPRNGILGMLIDQILDYHAQYKKANDVIANITISLDRGKTNLKNDNTTLEMEQQVMRNLTKKLKKEVELAVRMVAELERLIQTARARNEDQEKIAFITEEILFPLQQRHMDMQTMVVVNQQGVMTTELVIRNNKELIRGVERAINFTIPAFRNSVMIASALSKQKEVLDLTLKVAGITEKMITHNSEQLKIQGAEIQKLAMQANISVETMKTAYANVTEALDRISKFKEEALSNMRKSANEWAELATKGEEQIQKLETGQKLGL